MAATILNGNRIARRIRDSIRDRTERLRAAGERVPGLATILVGNDPASEVYVDWKHKDCAEVGFESVNRRLPETTSAYELLAVIDEYNAEPAIDGLLVQTPLPAHIDADRLVQRISPRKDVDGYHPFNVGRLALRRPTFRSATPKGIMRLLEETGVSIRGLNATVVGASNNVGRPMALELLLAGCTVTVAHKFTRDLPATLADADIVIAAAGRPRLIQGEWIKPGAIVIDVGINRQDDGKLIGDVDFDAAAERAAFITPVPGGVGPMTRAALLQNTLEARDQHEARRKRQDT